MEKKKERVDSLECIQVFKRLPAHKNLKSKFKEKTLGDAITDPWWVK